MNKNKNDCQIKYIQAKRAFFNTTSTPASFFFACYTVLKSFILQLQPQHVRRRKKATRKCEIERDEPKQQQQQQQYKKKMRRK